MKIPQIATITLLVLSSFAANSVTPSKTDLEAMYDKAFREFDANNYAEALKDLDAIDARQPDLAESQNLRGVIMMRQKEYAQAETALKKALAADPKFWNTRFNLAEVPFLQKNWPEARKRFQELLTGNASELQGEATQLIQYKILLTYLLEGKENMVNSSMAKFELAPDTPAVHYSNAALALNKKDENGAKEWLTKAEKAFSPQLNKLFAESLYEVGWLEKPAGHARVALELSSAADRAAQTQEFAEVKYEQAEQALAQRDLTAARKLVDEANGAAPNDARILNLRGEILLEQKEYDQAEDEFRKALKADPKSRDAQFNLAQVPFKKKEYAKARDRFESLFSVTSGADKDQAAQLIKFKIFLTLLLEGKDARAQKMMEQFQFTGDTPALYYAQAAMEFKNNNTTKANEWVTSARKIYSPALNGVFSESFFDVGWLQSPGVATLPAPMVADADQAETAPSIEPTPLPAVTLAQNTPATAADPLTLAANSAVPGMEATTSAPSSAASATLPSVGNISASTASSPSVETPVASTASPAAARPVVASAPDTEGSDANETSTAAVAATASTPATVLAPAQVREWSQPTLADRLRDGNTLLVAALLMAGILLLGWVVLAEFRRRTMPTPGSRGASRVEAPAVAAEESAGSIEQFVTPARLAGGPPQVSLQLRASEPALRRGSMPVGRSSRLGGNGTAIGGPAVATPEQHTMETEPFVARVAEAFDEGVGEPAVESDGVVTAFAPSAAEAPQTDEPVSDALVPPLDVRSENFASTPTDDVAGASADSQSAQIVEAVPAVAELPTVPLEQQEIEADSSIPLMTGAAVVEEPTAIAETINESVVSEPVAGVVTAFAPSAAEAPQTDEPVSDALVPPLDVQSENFASTPTDDVAGAPADSQSAQVVEAIPAVAELPTVPLEQQEIEADSSIPLMTEAAVVEEPTAIAETTGESVVSEPVAGVVTAFAPSAAEAPQTDEPASDALVPPLDVQSENFASTPTDDVAGAPADSQSAQVVEAIPAVAALPTMPLEQQEIEADSSIPLMTEAAVVEEPTAIAETINESVVSEPVAAEPAPAEPAADAMKPATSVGVAATPAAEEVSEPIGQGQPIPYQVPAFADGEPLADIPAAAPESPRTEAAALAAAGLAGIGALRHSLATPASAPRITINEPTAQQPTTAAIMPPTIPTPSPMIRTAPPTGAPQPTAATQPMQQPGGGAMHTAVQLTFSFEIASLQLTSTFKMGALQLRPTSKIVTMRLAPSQRPQPAMNLQVTFEIASVQLNGSALGVVRLTPSQQQRPGITSSPSFNIAGLQLVSGAESAPVQLTPSQQGQASVLVTAGFQIATVEFSPTFEIASIILNSTTPNVNVQLPGTGPSAVEGAPVFEIASVQLGGNGEIAMMQLNPAGSGPKHA